MAERTRLGVIGWPVAHSRSPQMMQAALAAVGLTDWRYQLLPIPPQLFPETVVALPQAGFRGANVTIPHKQTALTLAHEPSPAARAIGAANTLLFDPSGAIVADNTDAPGLIASLPFSPTGRSALVLGAGGTARAAVWALLDAGAADVRVWSRRLEEARRLADGLGAEVAAKAVPADVLINCTPVGMHDDGDGFKQLPLVADELAMYACVVDFVYGPDETPLVRSSRARGVLAVDGLELLVAQGAISFERFTGAEPPVGVMRVAARQP